MLDKVKEEAKASFELLKQREVLYVLAALVALIVLAAILG